MKEVFEAAIYWNRILILNEIHGISQAMLSDSYVKCRSYGVIHKRAHDLNCKTFMLAPKSYA